MRRKKDPNSYPELKKKLDKVFSVFIRERDNFVCFTCDKRGDAKNIQCGHFISRNYLSLRWDEINCHAQCVACNMFKGGNMIVYAMRMMDKYGADILKLLDARKNMTLKLSTIQLKILIDRYQSMVRN